MCARLSVISGIPYDTLLDTPMAVLNVMSLTAKRMHGGK